MFWVDNIQYHSDITDICQKRKLHKHVLIMQRGHDMNFSISKQMKMDQTKQEH